MNIELTDDEIAVLRRVLDKATETKVEEPKFQVGDWVEAVSDDSAGRFKAGARGIVEKWSPNEPNDVYQVDWKTGTFNPHLSILNYKAAYTSELRKIDPPATAPLKYKPGDIVLVPVRVVKIDDDDTPYGCIPVSGPDDDGDEDLYYFPRAALEPSVPQVGQRVIAWDDGTTGALSRVDAKDPIYTYRVESESDNTIPWYSHAVAIE